MRVRHFLVADGRAGTLEGRANEILAAWGVELREWQRDPWSEMWAVDADGRLLYGPAQVFITAPRQTGKTHLVMLWLLVYLVMIPDTEVLWSSHHGTTTTATLRDLVDMCDAYHIPYKSSDSQGREELWVGPRAEKKKGSHIRFGSRERGLGRGLHGIDITVADESQKASPKFLETSLAAMNSSRSPLGSILILMGTAPEADASSEGFLETYREAVPADLAEFAGRQLSRDGSLVIDLGATNSLRDDPDADLLDPAVLAQANPEYLVSVPHAVFARAYRKLTRGGFLREYLNVFTDTGITSETGILFGNPALYARQGFRMGRVLALGAGVSPDESDVVLAAVAEDAETGQEFVATVGRWGSIPESAPEIARIVREQGVSLQLDNGGPAGPLGEALDGMGVAASYVPDADGNMLRRLREELKTGEIAVSAEDEALIASMRTVTPRSRETGGAQLSRRRGEPAAVEAAMNALDCLREGSAGGAEFW